MAGRRYHGQRHLIGRTSLAYHEALSCMRALIRADEMTVDEPAGAASRALLLDTPVFIRRLCARLSTIAGMMPEMRQGRAMSSGTA